MIVLDTHILVWYLTDDSRLPRTLRTRLSQDPESVLVPSIGIWETILLIERGRIAFHGYDSGQTVRDLVRNCGFKETSLTGDIALLSRQLPFEHEDPADRFIAATAHALNAELATVDSRLTGLPWLRIASI